jgi:C-terminal processing protease CtpA/Prc
MQRNKHALRPLALTLLAALAAVPASAQQRERTPQRVGDPDRTFRMFINGQEVTDQFGDVMQRRARLGITVNLLAKETDSLGALVTAVTPGGPASKAGIRSGDIITRLDGTSVLTEGNRTADRDESAPGVRLIELAAKLEPNDTITVDFLRGDARRTTTLVTGDERIIVYDGRNLTIPTPRGEAGIRIPELRVEPGEPGLFQFSPRAGGFGMAFGSGALRDLELAPMNPDLGSYFGTTEGVLVIRASSTGSLGLKSGDVVLSVDGRQASSPAALLRILRSYADDESFKVEIQRQKQRQTLTAKLGTGRDDD